MDPVEGFRVAGVELSDIANEFALTVGADLSAIVLNKNHRRPPTALQEHVRRYLDIVSLPAANPQSLDYLHFFGFTETSLSPLPALTRSNNKIRSHSKA